MYLVIGQIHRIKPIDESCFYLSQSNNLPENNLSFGINTVNDKVENKIFTVYGSV